MPILDTRPPQAFLAGHAAEAVNIPLEELPLRIHELPPKGRVIYLFEPDPSRRIAACELLTQRRYRPQPLSLPPEELLETGPSRSHLWEPTPFLLEILESFPPAITETAAHALDLACGAGREAVFLALQGWQVTAVDLLPDALAKAADLARRHNVQLRLFQQDLRKNPHLPAQSFQLITFFRFYHPPLLPVAVKHLAPDGLLAVECFNQHDPKFACRPSASAPSLDQLLASLTQATPPFETLIARPDVERDGRRFFQLLVRRR